MNDITQKTLKIIEQQKIKPRPRWHFLLKDYLLWFSFACSIIVGSLAVSTIIFMLTSNDWDVYKYLDRSLFKHIFISMPYLWIAILALLTFTAYYNFKYTRRGYRYEIHTIILGSALISLILGIILFFGGLGSEIHEIFMRQIPFYNNFVYCQKEVWDNPQKGLLGGKIIKVENQNEFLLQDFNGKIWQIKKENPYCCNQFLIQCGSEVELIGHLGEDNIFFIKEIRPWQRIKWLYHLIKMKENYLHGVVISGKGRGE